MQFYLPIAEMPVNVLLLLGMGAAVGFVAGMFGVGGGFLLTPFLIFMGVPTAVAVASASAQIVASSSTSALAAWQNRAVDPKLGGILVAGGLAGTLLGVAFFNAMRRIGQLDLIISVSYIVLLSGIGGLMLVETLRTMLAVRRGLPRMVRQPGSHRWFEGLPLKVRFTQSRLYVSAIPFLCTGLLFGFIGAVLGIGGGFMLVPALIYVFRVPLNVVVGTSQLQILCTMLVATMLHAVSSGTVDMILALILIVGGVFGAAMGVRAGQRLTGEHFRLMLALLILAVGARFAVDMLVRPTEPFSIIRTEIPAVKARATAAFLLLAATAAEAEELVVMMSTQDVAITSTYTGARVTIFGAIERDATTISRPSKYDVVISVAGPASPLLVRQKEKYGPFWVNQNLMRYADVPGYYALSTTGPIATVANEAARERQKMGMTYLLPPPSQLPDELNPEKTAREALFRLRKQDAMLIEDARGVQMPRPNLFSAAVPLPAKAPVGRYLVSVTVLADGVPLKTSSTSFVVRKIGFEAYMAAYARDEGWLYGLVTVLSALFIGLLGNLLFRRD